MKVKFLHDPLQVGFHVLLCGIDFEGESREMKCFTLTDAISMAYRCSISDSSGPPWKDWEIWGNVLDKDSNWECVAQKD